MTDAVARLAVEQRGPQTVLRFAGRLDAEGAGLVWRPTLRAARGASGLTFDLGGVVHCDMAGAALLAAAEAVQGGTATLDSPPAQLESLLDRARAASRQVPHAAPPPAAAPLARLRGALGVVSDGIAFLGELAFAWVRLPVRRKMLRPADLLRYADQAGVRALPLVLLLGYLMGLILAFQSAIPMRRFGADLFVANLVAISLLRELGPLLSAVILAGRTGSAFAAEIGTMKVNEEIDALTTMGLDPVTMLVLPRLIAAMLVMPALALALDLAGLLGMATVMNAFGFPLVTIAHQVQSAATASDLFGGLFKGLCFGAAVAAIGCRAGLSTGVGPRAVGLSATAAVVGGIVSTILLDGLFALMFYRLGL
ncbi:MAG: ABC transporter permease [Acetobacteraceae bacterium]|nr:ABC transporter permease [Acetobacteraceae bacterium]